MKKVINTEKAPKAIGPYSQAILVDDILFCSGQTPLVPETGKLAEGDVSAQTEQVCKNISAVLIEAGYEFEDVIKTTCFLTTMDDFAAFNAVYEKYFISKPARSTVAVKELPVAAKVEVEVIAKK